MSSILRFALVLFVTVATLEQCLSQNAASAISIVGYLRDSACVHRFEKVTKPLPNGCLEACVRGGSPLVVLTKDERIYQPISAEMPDVDVRQKLLPFVGKLVRITGHVYKRDGSSAISLERIEEVRE